MIRAGLLVTCFNVLFAVCCWSQQSNEFVDREIVVMFQPGSILYEGNSLEGDFATSNISPRVRGLFNAFGIDRIRKGFPEFSTTERVRYNDQGRAVQVEDLTNVHVVRIPAGQSRQFIIERLKELPEVLYAEENTMMDVRSGATEPYFSQQWNMRNTGQSGGTVGADVKAVDAWDVFPGSSTQVLGIVDNGWVYYNHEEFQGNRVFGDFTQGAGIHATFVAGVAAANGENNLGIAGMDWRTRINTQTFGDVTGTANAIRAAVNSGSTIVNNSWGQSNNTYYVTLASAFSYAYKMNSLSTIASAQNSDPYDYPALYGSGIGVLNVTSTDHNDLRSTWAIPKSYNHVAAPGGGDGVGSPTAILTTDPWENYFWGNFYAWFTGTSASTPHVSGIASLMKGYDPTLVNDDVKHIIQFSADDVNSSILPGWDSELGYGRVNARQALDYVSGYPYRVVRGEVTGGSVYSNIKYLGNFYGLPGGAPDGYYIGRRYEVRATVTFPVTFRSAKGAWGRGPNSVGYNWSIYNNNYCANYCEIVPGTLTPTGATFRTWVYNIARQDGSWAGWYPTDPGNAVFAWSVLGWVDSTVNTSVVANWNMTGVPVVAPDFSKTVIYPTAVSAASRWDVTTGSYVPMTTLRNGEGYWIKFGTSPQTIPYVGAPIYSYPMKVYKSPVTGWNMIGSIAAAVPVAQITQNPPGIVVGPYYKYDNGYVPVTTLQPGLGFWLQVNSTGTLTMKGQPGGAKTTTPEFLMEGLDQFIVMDHQGGRQEMFVGNKSFNRMGGGNQAIEDVDLPPDPPEGLFNVRFKSGKYVQCVVASVTSTNIPILIKTAKYPIIVKWSIQSAQGLKYSLSFGDQPNEMILGSSGEFTINDSTVRELVLAVQSEGNAPNMEFVLDQNSPNPFNPVTVVSYFLPRELHVELKVFNALGQEVKTLVDGLQSPGPKEVSVDLADYPSGIYFYRVRAGEFLAVKKMILMK